MPTGKAKMNSESFLVIPWPQPVLPDACDVCCAYLFQCHRLICFVSDHRCLPRCFAGLCQFAGNVQMICLESNLVNFLLRNPHFPGKHPIPFPAACFCNNSVRNLPFSFHFHSPEEYPASQPFRLHRESCFLRSQEASPQ